MTIDEMHRKGLLLFEAVSGSRAYGLATETSDTDIKGVFYLPKDWFFGREYLPQINSERNDVVYYELGRFLELLGKSNPGALELLATPEEHVRYRHPLMHDVHPGMFLSRQARNTFGGYALKQVKKAGGLNRIIHDPQPEKRKSLMEFCFIPDGARSVPVRKWLKENGLQEESCRLTRLSHAPGLYAVHYDASDRAGGLVAENQIRCSSVPKESPVIAYLFCQYEAYEIHCRRHREYWTRVANRNEARHEASPQDDKGYDAKNMMHTIRLLEVARDLFRNDRLDIVSRNREELLAIRRGEWTYENLLNRAEELIAEMDAAVLTSRLPETADAGQIEALLVRIRRVLYDE